MLNPSHLRTLESVCRTGSFAETARELGYTSSAISQQVQALEKSIGAQLFEREAQGVRANRLAHRIVEASAPTIVELQRLTKQVEQIVAGGRGSFTIGTFATASVRFVSAALADLVRDRADLTVSLIEAEPREILPMISDGSVDLGVIYEYGLAPPELAAGAGRRRAGHRTAVSSGSPRRWSRTVVDALTRS